MSRTKLEDQLAELFPPEFDVSIHINQDSTSGPPLLTTKWCATVWRNVEGRSLNLCITGHSWENLYHLVEAAAKQLTEAEVD